MTLAELYALMTIEGLSEARPDLIEKFESESMKKYDSLETKYNELNESVAASKLSSHKAELMAGVAKIVTEAKLPEKIESRVKGLAEKIEVEVETTAEAMKEAVTKIIADEKAYLESVAGPKIFGNGGSESTETSESVDTLLSDIVFSGKKK